MREMILASNVENRKLALAKLLPLQRADFEGIFEAMDGLLIKKELIIEGVVAIKEGENPKYIRDKLMNFLTEDEIRKANGESPSKGGKSKGKKGKAVES